MNSDIFYKGGFYPTVEQIINAHIPYLESGVVNRGRVVWCGSLPIPVYERSKVDLPAGIDMVFDESYVYFRRYLTNKDLEPSGPAPGPPKSLPMCRCQLASIYKIEE